MDKRALKREYPDYLKFVNDDKNGQIDLAKTLEAGNRLFEQRIFLQATAEEREGLIKRRIAAERDLTKALIEQKQVEQSGNAGQTVGFARNEAGELSNRPTRGQLAGAGVEGVRKSIAIINNEIEKLNKEADATSLRVYGKTAAELDATLNGSKSVGGTSGGGGGKKLSEEVNAASDSIEYLQKRLSKLNDEFERAPQSEWPEPTPHCWLPRVWRSWQALGWCSPASASSIFDRSSRISGPQQNLIFLSIPHGHG